MIKGDFFQEWKDGPTSTSQTLRHHMNKMKDKESYDHFNRQRKNKKSTFTFDLKINKVDIKEMYLSIIKTVCDKLTTNFIHREKMKAFPLTSETN